MPKDYKKFLKGQTLSYLLAEPSNEQLNEEEDGNKDLYEIIEKASEIKGDALANNQLKIKTPTKNSKIVQRLSDNVVSKGVGSSKNTPANIAEQAQLFAMSALTCIERNNSSKATWNAIRAQNAIISARKLLTEIHNEIELSQITLQRIAG